MSDPRDNAREAAIPRVLIAEPYRPGAMSSLGDAAYMYMRQHAFPHTYDGRDRLQGADDDRIWSWDHEHAKACCERHMGGGPLKIGTWIRHAKPEQILAFLVELLKQSPHPFEDPEIGWTGFRVLGTVHRGNGFPVHTLEIFAKHPESTTRLYTGMKAPNVQPGGYAGFGYRGMGVDPLDPSVIVMGDPERMYVPHNPYTP